MYNTPYFNVYRSDSAGFLFIFTLRVPLMADTNGVTDSLNGVTANIAANYPGISFTPVMRFGMNKTLLLLHYFKNKINETLHYILHYINMFISIRWLLS